MAFPDPEPGLVVQYGYLWRHEHDRGRESARYGRPCAIVVALRADGGETSVLLAPLTHQPPGPERRALPLPEPIRTALGLGKPTWVVVDELNTFVWPGVDLERNAHGDFVWGRLPEVFRRKVRDAILEAQRRGALSITQRSGP